MAKVKFDVKLTHSAASASLCESVAVDLFAEQFKKLSKSGSGSSSKGPLCFTLYRRETDPPDEQRMQLHLKGSLLAYAHITPS